MHEINPNQSPVYLNAGLFYFILIFNQVKHSFLIFQLIVAMSIMFSSCSSRKLPEEIQLTNDLSYNHDLDNNDNFSPDDQWLVYDTRTLEGGIGACPKIERVNVLTGEKKVLYELPQNKSYGPGVGAVSYGHTENKVVFIHGLLNITEENPYQQWRRTGVIIDDSNPGIPIFMDSRNVSTPFIPGALRGGTHRHEWSRDGRWIGYTYNDAIMKQLEDSTGETYNLRTIGVSKEIKAPLVDTSANGANIAGEWFSALVVKVVADPVPGSDEISRAAGDSWVGVSGYKTRDGSIQRARGFIGTVKNKKGEDVDEVFIVDIPDDITTPGPDGPLEGTTTSMPFRPKGAVQKRLTFTATTANPGCTGIVRSSADGSKLAFLSSDEHGIQQIFTIAPTGGVAAQQSFHSSDVQSGVRWHPNGNKICYVWEDRLIIKKLATEDFTAVTTNTENPPTDLVWSHDGKSIAYNRLAKSESGESTKQIFILKL